MKITGPLPYQQWQVDINLLHYDNGRFALQLVDHEDSEPITTATVNLVDEDCPHDEVWVKDWSENEGITDWLAEHEVIEPQPTDNTQTGHAQAQRYKLSQKFLELIGDALVREGERSRR